MLITVLLIAVSGLAYSAPVPVLPRGFDPITPFTIFGREFPGCTDTSCNRTMPNIIWSCLATIFACSWVAYHPDIPRSPTSGWIRFRKRVVDVILIIIAPEFVTMWALGQRIKAESIMEEYNERFHPEKQPPQSPWSRFKGWLHSLCGRLKEWFRTPEAHKGVESNSPWTITHGFFIQMGGLVQDSGDVVHSVRCLPGPLDISEDEISDKSKGDFFTKLLAIAQTTWFIFQCVTRWAVNLPVTDLEVVTLAFALLSIGTWILWWHKPQSLRVPILMSRHTKREAPQVEAVQLERNPEQTKLGVGEAPGAGEAVIPLVSERELSLNGLRSRIVSTTSSASDVSKHPHTVTPSPTMLDSWKCALPICLIGVVFGSVHLLPLWPPPFPSSPEELLWGLSAFWITVQPILFFSLGLWGGWTVRDWKADRYWAWKPVQTLHVSFAVLIGGILYVAARLVLLVLAFTTLRTLSPDAYRNIPWMSFLPHL